MKQKKVFVVLLACLVAFAICLPVFAENEVDISAYARTVGNTTTSTENTIDTINATTAGDDLYGIMPINEEADLGLEGGAENTASYFVNSDMYYLNDDVVVTEPINGNVFIFGSNVTISSVINGNVFVMGNSVTIDSNAFIYGSIFSFSNSLTVNGQASDVYAAGNQITLGTDASISRDLKSVSAQLFLNGSIDRNAYAAANEITLSNTATIGKDFEYTAKTQTNIPNGAVSGDVHFTQMQETEDTKTIGDYVYAIVTQAIFVFVIYLVCLGIAPKFSEKAATVLKKKWGASIGLGIAGLIGIPVFAFLLLTTGIATNLSIYTFTFYALLLASGFTVVCIAINHILADKFQFTKKWMPLVSILAVAIVLGIIKLIPFFGVILTTFGLGIFIVSLFYHPEKQEA